MKEQERINLSCPLCKRTHNVKNKPVLMYCSNCNTLITFNWTLKNRIKYILKIIRRIIKI